MKTKPFHNNNEYKYQGHNKHNWAWKTEGITVIEIIFQNMQKQLLSSYEKEICKELISQNVPEHLRSKVWLLTSGAKRQIIDHPFYYDNLLKISQEVPSLYQRKIEVDIQRTVIGNSQEEKEVMINHQRNILRCYSIRNSSIGYCQGFNYIVNKLYKIIQDEEETFWLFSQIIEDILPLNYYSESIGSMTDATIIYGLIKVFFPKLNEYFKQIEKDMNPTLIIHTWLISLFTLSFADDTINFILDMFFLEGNSVLIQITLSVFFLLEKYIIDQGLKFENLSSIINENSHIITPNLLFPFFKNNIFKFPIDHINSLRHEMIPKIIDSFNIDSDLKCILLKCDKMDKCSHSYPYCLTIDSIEIKSKGIEYLILTQEEPWEIIDDYYFDPLVYIYNESMEDSEEEGNSYNILLERRKHYCGAEDDSLSDYRKFSDGDSERNTNYKSFGKHKTLKIIDKEDFLCERLSKLTIVAEDQYDLITRLSCTSRGND